MRKLYSVTFDLGVVSGEAPTREAVVEEVKLWLQSTDRRPEGAYAPTLRHNFLAGGRSVEGEKTVETVSWDEGREGGWAMRWVQPGEEAGPRFVSEVVLRRAGDELGFSMHVGYERALPRGRGVRFKRPRLVPQLLRKFGGHSGLSISAEPTIIDVADIEDFVGVLESVERKFPVVVLSIDPQSEVPPCRPDLAADVLAGLAHVYAFSDVEASYQLTDTIGKIHSCFNGCGRIYWPRWTRDDDPFKHRLVWPEDLRPGNALSGGEYHGPNRLLSILATAAVSTSHPSPQGFDEVMRKVESDRLTAEGLQLSDELDDANGEIASLKVEVEECMARIAELGKRRVHRLRVAVFLGSAERGGRRAAWDRRFEVLSKDASVEMDAEYCEIHRQWPGRGFDYWVLDQKTVAGHKELRARFGEEAKRAGAQWLSVRDTTDLRVTGARLNLSS